MYAYVNHSEFRSSRWRLVVFASGLSGGMQWLSNATRVSHSSLSFRTIPLYFINHTDRLLSFPELVLSIGQYSTDPACLLPEYCLALTSLDRWSLLLLSPSDV
jgi:hypothetical protein